MDEIFILAIPVLALVILMVVLMLFLLGIMRPWLQCRLSGAPISTAHIVGMRLRRTPPTLIVDAYIALKKRRVQASLAEVETMYLAQGRSKIDAAELADLVEQKRAEENA